MKHFLLIFTLFALNACAGGASDENLKTSDDGRGAGMGGGCKSLYSTWTSTSDSEVHNFTALANGAQAAYSYTSGDGTKQCGSSGAIGQITAQLPAQGWTLDIKSAYRFDSACSDYQLGNPRLQRAQIVMDGCNQLKICAYGAYPGDCKTFN